MRFIAIVLTLVSLDIRAQEWIEHSIDSTLTVLLPDNYIEVDTMGQRVVTSQVDYGMALVSIVPNEGKYLMNVQNEKDSMDAYKGYQSGVIQASKGKLIKEETIERYGLKLSKFSCTGTMGDEKHIRHYLLAFVNNKSYAFQFWELESMTNETKESRERFFSSIRFPRNLSFKNQMTYSVEADPGYKIGYSLGRILGVTLICGVLILPIIWLTKRKKVKNR